MPRFKPGDLTNCMFCRSSKMEHTDFRDSLSLKESLISGVCQECQDKTFGVDGYCIKCGEDIDDCVEGRTGCSLSQGDKQCQ